MRVGFTSLASNTLICIKLDVSSEANCDFAFIGTLDNDGVSYDNGYYTRISGTDSVTVEIPVPEAGNHFIEIGYGKDVASDGGSDRAWFEIID
ncbi:MAG: hypothetical protein LBI91_04245 [Spirochaetaceae bacterium]|jgi:hypothetical protein|nr:hypothetical protein [Spirochaetaceae bacterium]